MNVGPEELVIIEKLIKSEFKGLTREMVKELTQDAALFLLTSEETALVPGLLKKLKDHLKTRLSRGKEDPVSNLRDPRGEPLSDEEWLSRALLVPEDAGRGDKPEVEMIFELPEKVRREDYINVLEGWREFLPAPEYEALALAFDLETEPQWTWGIEPVGLRMLFLRAMIRVKWRDDQ